MHECIHGVEGRCSICLHGPRDAFRGWDKSGKRPFFRATPKVPPRKGSMITSSRGTNAAVYEGGLTPRRDDVRRPARTRTRGGYVPPRVTKRPSRAPSVYR